MQKTFVLLLAALFASAVASAQERRMDDVVVIAETKSVPISITGAPELKNLADLAFESHGAFRRVASGGTFTINFAAAGANQVTVTVTRGGASVLSQTVSGSSTRNALLRAADAAVTKMTGLRGYFAGQLAFIAERSGQQTIMTGDLFFGEVQSHPVQGKQIVGPRWSPDGSKIVFTSYRTGFPDIYALDLRARSLNTLVSLKGTNSGGRLSPDGTRLAMVLSGEGNPEIYVGNAEGRQIRRLTNNQSVEASPAWSPDGSRLVFTSDAAGGPQLYVMSASGGAMQRLNTNVSRYCAEPDWSHTAPTKIVFTAAVGRGYQIAVFDMATGAGKIVTKAPMDAVEPVWLADGRHAICTFRSANARALWIVDTESGKATRVSPTALGNAWNASYLAP